MMVIFSFLFSVAFNSRSIRKGDMIAKTTTPLSRQTEITWNIFRRVQFYTQYQVVANFFGQNKRQAVSTWALLFSLVVFCWLRKSFMQQQQQPQVDMRNANRRLQALQQVGDNASNNSFEARGLDSRQVWGTSDNFNHNFEHSLPPPYLWPDVALNQRNGEPQFSISSIHMYVLCNSSFYHRGWIGSNWIQPSVYQIYHVSLEIVFPPSSVDHLKNACVLFSGFSHNVKQQNSSPLDVSQQTRHLPHHWIGEEVRAFAFLSFTMFRQQFWHLWKFPLAESASCKGETWQHQ